MFLRGLFFLCFIQFAQSQIIITEVMYDLDGSDSPNEFIEIFNTSSTDTIDLTGWQIRDRSSVDALVDSGYGLVLSPESYGLIMEGDYSFTNGIYADSIPEYVTLIKVDDSSIGNGLSTQDSIYIISSNNTVQDSVGWVDVSPDGYSLEKIRIELPNSPANWSPSIDSLGTPGEINSVEPLNIDGELISGTVTAEPSIVTSAETLTISGYVTNQGRNWIFGEVVIFFETDIIETFFIPSLNELDTTNFSMVVGPFSSGYHSLDIRFNVNDDEDNSNNTDQINIGVRFDIGLITINEFLPVPESGEPEFVELYYHGDEILTLTDWGIADRVSNPAKLNEVTIGNETYLVIGSDSSIFQTIPDTSIFLTPLTSFPALNNSGDAIKLYDPFDTLIDSLEYSNHWGFSTGRSMEKIYPYLSSSDSVSWQPAVDISRSTPGSRNSVMPWPIDGSIISELIIYSPSIPTHLDSIHFQIPIRNSGQGSMDGDLYIEYEEDELASLPLSITTPGDTATFQLSIASLSSGHHDLFLALDLSGDGDFGNNSDTLQVKVRYPFGNVLINEFMARPNNDQSEFIELVSLNTISLSEWSFSDNTKQQKSIDQINFGLGDYLVLAPDSSLFPLENNNAHFLVSENGWASLNNSGDGIYIYDHTGSIIDSLIYNIDWPLADEISTEKLRPEFTSNASSNWGLTADPGGSTPGSANSIALFDLDGALLGDSIKHEPRYPKNTEMVTIYSHIVNMGVTTFSGSMSLSIDGDEYGTSVLAPIEPGDTTIHILEFGPLVSGYHRVELDLAITGDENTTNNTAIDSVLVSYEPGVVTLNEYLAVPDSTQTEFIELVALDDLLMNNWAISDNSMTKREFSFGSINDGEILILAADSSITAYIPDDAKWRIPNDGLPGLNNSSDHIYLLDMTGVIIDSLVYTDNWNMVEYRSMEKYRPEFDSNDSSRWAVAVNDEGQTPGVENSIYYEELQKAGQLDLEPDPFSPDGDGMDDLLYIKYKLPFEYGVVSIQIFDVIGREIAVPYWNIYTAQENILTWNGRRSNGELARIGIYIIKVKAKDSISSKIWEDIQTVILAKKL